MVFYIQVFGSAKFEIKHKMVLENYFKNNILGSLDSSCHKEELWNKDYNGIFFNFGCSYSKFSYCWSDSWTCLYFIFWGQGQQRKWRNEESVSTPGYQKFSWVLARNLVPWFLDIIVFQFSVTLVYQPPLFSKKKTSKIGFWLYFSNFASLGPILDHLQKTPLKNIILAYLENSLSKIAGRKVSSLSCCFFL